MSLLLIPTNHAQSREKQFHQDKDSLYIMLMDARKLSNNGDFIKGDERIEEVMDYYYRLKDTYGTDNYSFENLEFEILNTQAWSKTLLKKYSLSEILYKSLIENTPDTAHLNLSRAYTGISSIYGQQKMYDLCEEYAQLALNEAKLAHDSEAAFHAQSNLGDIFMETGHYEEALEKYLEVRRLSVLIGRNEAISLGNLGIVYLKLGKTGLADQYFQESLALSKEDAPVVYSIILPTYCELLMDIGDKRKARKLVLEAVNDSRYTQMSEYNLQYLKLLSELYPKNNTPYFITVSIILLIIILLLLLKYRKNNHQTAIISKENKELEKEITHLRENQTETETETINIPQENVVRLIGFFESFPQIHALINKIKLKPDNKTEVSASVKELAALLAPFTSEQMEQEMAYYIEQNNSDFYEKLKNDYPHLSLTDLRLCTLIKLGMNTKEIAVLTNKSVRGVESAKFRLRKKLNIESSKDIYDYLLEIEKSIIS